MSILHIVALVLEALLGLFMAYAAYSLFTWTPPSMVKVREALRYPRWWWLLAGGVATASAIGLLVGLALPIVAGIAVVWTVAYFVVATCTHFLRKDFAGGATPLVFLLPVLGLLALQWASLTPILAALGL